MTKNVSRETNGVYLPLEISNEIWQSVQEQSAVMRLAQQMDLPGGGTSVPLISGDPVAEWVAETDEVIVDTPTFDNKAIQGYTLGVIVPFSNQFKRDKAALYNACVKRLPGVLSEKFDATVFGQASGAPGPNFDTLGAVTAIDIATNTYDSLVTAKGAVGTGGGRLTGWAMSDQAETILLMAKDGNGRPIYIPDAVKNGEVPAILAKPIYSTKAVYLNGTPPQVGFGGDWSNARFGIVEGIKISMSDQATLTLSNGDTLNLWQRKMFAVMVDFEVGFRVKTLAEFVKLTG